MGVRLSIRSADGRPVEDGLAYAFDQSRVVIGRGAGADVRLPHLTVSERHATLLLDGNAHALVDEGSTNGTRVNGAPLVPHRKRRLTEGDTIEVGVFALAFHAGALVTQPLTVERTAELARRLYRSAQGADATPGPRLVVLDGPKTGHSLQIPPAPARCIVGRDPSCQLELPDPDASREHVELIHDLDGVEAVNLESKNGLAVGGRRVERQRLKDGDELLVGGTRLLFEEPAQAPIETMTGEADLELPPPPPAPEPEPTREAEEPGTPPPERPARRPSPPASLDADLIIYALAGIVFLVSMAGLFLLMR